MATIISDVDHYLWSPRPFEGSHRRETKLGTIFVLDPGHAHQIEITAGEAPVYSSKRIIVAQGETVIVTLINHAYEGRSKWQVMTQFEAQQIEKWKKNKLELEKRLGKF